MFKADWEKTSVTHPLPPGLVEKMIQLACPKQKLISYELIAGGCANLNIKFSLENKKQPLILRVYLRDTNAASREQKLAALLKQSIPIPTTYSINELENYHFAITEYVPGILLRDLLLDESFHDMSPFMYEVGTILSKIGSHVFSEAGFFDKDLNVIPHESPNDLINFIQDCLEHKVVLDVLPPNMILEVTKIFEKYNNDLLFDEHEKHLVHGDFDPSNILVDKVDGFWKVTAILDFEFAFSGSILWDVANMLRYAQKMPYEFQASFIKGLMESGAALPNHWPTIIKLFNLSSLLDCLKRSSIKSHPNRCKDIYELINTILIDLRML